VVGWGRYLVVVDAFAFAVFASLIVYGISRLKDATPQTLILSGIAVMYLFSSLTSVLQYIGRREDVHAVVFWLMGSLNGSRWGEVGMILGALILSTPFLVRCSPDLNAMLGGDEVAKSLGVNVKRVRILVMMLSTFITSSIICFTGTIGFIGLVSPHITRMLIGADHLFLLPATGVLGALLLLLADTLSRTIIAPTEIPVGIATSFIGIPFFLYLLMRRRSGG
jgi:iron complex transport system permease protein